MSDKRIDYEKHYNPWPLLNRLDIDGQKPTIFIVSGNRTGGKTFTFKDLMLWSWIQDHSKKFAFIYRKVNQMSGCAENFFKDLSFLPCYQGHAFTAKPRDKGSYYEFMYDGESCGYAIALNHSDEIKQQSALFSDIDAMQFDEFQAKDGKYLTNEFDKLQDIYISVARGKGQNIRPVKLYMTSNAISILNPYYAHWHIGERLRKDTKFLKGKGWVMQNFYNPYAAEEIRESAFGRAFADTSYMKSSLENVYLEDNASFIKNCTGGRYHSTLVYGGKNFSVRILDNGFYYVDNSYDDTFPIRLTTVLDEHNPDTVLVKPSDIYVQTYRLAFNKGLFRFKNLECKNVLINTISY